MKYFFIILLALPFIIGSCKKEKDTQDVRYEFTSDLSANYKIEYTIDTDKSITENYTGTTWSKTVTITKNDGYAVPTAIKLAVYPPASWVNTNQQANITIKIFVNGSESASKTAVITGNDLSMGIWEIVTL